ncbi:putative CtpA-like serine protease [Candidatus Phycosocius bacilliformis]|uniref:Putative CtpA-like serine protease n=1 Tax=Candidatus Phycosocius bacilliformis TaxID=1445552 RepID=A0A2P2ECZ7_9PROT|nr:S41 family peptidase [Candidatus Phycosocius bacilliformis]GBF58914.1 putative CtpA-like serine protease [Candidatus Phycosocius bacilliformis]
MKYTRFIAFLVFACWPVSLLKAFAQPLGSSTETSLRRLDEAAEAVRLAYCEPDKRRVFAGAIKGINALPERKDAAPIVLSTPDFGGFAKAYKEVLQAKTDPSELDKAVLKGMAQVFDAGNEFVIHKDRPPGLRAGILVGLKIDSSGVVIVRPIPYGPAADAGILAGDRLKAIDGKPITDLSEEEVASQLVGPYDSDVAVTIVRDGIEKTFAIRRAPLDFPQVRHRVVDGIGVLAVSSFQEDTGKQVRDAIRAIRQEIRKPTGYILDLRFNAGGALDGVIGLVDIFASRGLILTDNPSIQCKTVLPKRFYARPGDEANGAPIVVLVNDETAVGAELAAAALREIRQAKIVGQRTSGRVGSSLAIGPIFVGNDHGYLVLRIGTYVQSSGKAYEDFGIIPDVLVKADAPQVDAEMEQAIEILKTPQNQSLR